jgi:hypothetical protein
MLQNVSNTHILKVGAWVLGEYSQTIVEDLQSIEEIVLMLISVYDRCVEKEHVVDWLVPAIIKLSQT